MHTAEPWTAEKDGRVTSVHTPDPICTVKPDDAKLIAQAPVMLRLLKETLQEISEEDCDCEEWPCSCNRLPDRLRDDIEAAIARADGLRG